MADRLALWPEMARQVSKGYEYHASNMAQAAPELAPIRGERLDTSPEALEVLPSLKELRIRPEILEAAEDVLAGIDTVGVEPERLATVVRLVVASLRTSSS